MRRLALRPLARARRALRRFAADRRGTISVEAAVMMPFLLGLFAVSFVWFDAFRAKNNVLKATYTISDMISRETVPLPDAYFNGLSTVFDFMTATGQETRLRITAIKCTEDCADENLRKLEMCWSWATGNYTPHDTSTVPLVYDAVPLMVLGDTVVVTEGISEYSPLFDRWMGDITLRNTIVTRPRFAPQIAYGTEKCY
jgi:Flp pilus assembly protein TadG